MVIKIEPSKLQWPERQFLAAIGLPLTILTWLMIRFGFGVILPQHLLEHVLALVCLAAGASLFVSALVRPSEWRWMVVNGVLDSLAALTFFWLERPDRLWILPAVVTAGLWILSLRAAIRRIGNDLRTHQSKVS